MRNRRLSLFFRAAAVGTGAPAPSPAPAPTPSAVTAALLTLTTPNATLGVGDTATATLAPGITGDFTFTREASSTATTAATTNSGALVLGTGSGNSATYVGAAADADKRINVVASNLSFAAGLTAALDPTAVLSFYGSATAGSTLTASMIAGATGTITIKRANGTVAANAMGVSTVSYTVAAGDSGSFSATASAMVLTVPFSATAGAVNSSPFVTAQAYMAGTTVAAADVFSIRLADGVLAKVDFTSNGATVSTQTAPQLNGASYFAVAGDVGHQINAVISGLSFTTGGVYGSPVVQSATSAPLLYSLDITVDAPNRIRIGFPALNNLDTTSVPPPSAFALGGTIAFAKTVSSVSIDNSDSSIKYVYVVLSSSFQPGDAPTIAYSGTAIRYPGGAPAASFSALPVFSNIPPPATPMVALTNTQYVRASSPNPGTVLMLANSVYVTELAFDSSQSQRTGTTQDCLLQMSILPDWGTDMSIARRVGFDAYPPSFGTWYWEQYQVVRSGNTVTLWERLDGAGSNSASGASYTFQNPGPLCLARIRYVALDTFVHLETSEDGGTTWTQRSISVTPHTGNLYPTAWSNSTTVPITGVGSNGFATT